VVSIEFKIYCNHIFQLKNFRIASKVKLFQSKIHQIFMHRILDLIFLEKDLPFALEISKFLIIIIVNYLIFIDITNFQIFNLQHPIFMHMQFYYVQFQFQ
jgi:hypothetical protein